MLLKMQIKKHRNSKATEFSGSMQSPGDHFYGIDSFNLHFYHFNENTEQTSNHRYILNPHFSFEFLLLHNYRVRGKKEKRKEGEKRRHISKSLPQPFLKAQSNHSYYSCT